MWTCREEKLLEDAVDWCEEHGIKFDAVNENFSAMKFFFGGIPRKILCHFYIDNKGCTPETFYS
ncbi:MAG: hypothetical protein ACI4ES_14050 [Roseburia sp.]